ncbi:MAG: hypothetical protein K9N07_11775 [Candidatus Cloacimonetes bacterium]|nr:hypothetical protein [Candidatus Cloacimonadota bacterium]
MKAIHKNIENMIYKSVKIAPLFHHGPGFTRYGTSQEFNYISKDDAKVIIFDTLKNNGIEFDTTNCPTLFLNKIPKQKYSDGRRFRHFKYETQVVAPDLDKRIAEIDHLIKIGNLKEALHEIDIFAYWFFCLDLLDRKKMNNKISEFICNFKDEFVERETEKVEIKLDGYNEEYNLAILFVNNFYDVILTPTYPISTAGSIDFRECANILRRQLIYYNNMNFGIFYDPGIMIDSSDENYNRAAFNAAGEANQLLLAQVNDFIEWFNNEELLDNIFLRNILEHL